MASCGEGGTDPPVPVDPRCVKQWQDRFRGCDQMSTQCVNVNVRGIFATGLTALLCRRQGRQATPGQASFCVCEPSKVILERFPFLARRKHMKAHVQIQTLHERTGIGIQGHHTRVIALRTRLREDLPYCCGSITLGKGAMVVGRVESVLETTSSGTITYGVSFGVQLGGTWKTGTHISSLPEIRLRLFQVDGPRNALTDCVWVAAARENVERASVVIRATGDDTPASLALSPNLTKDEAQCEAIRLAIEPLLSSLPRGVTIVVRGLESQSLPSAWDALACLLAARAECASRRDGCVLMEGETLTHLDLCFSQACFLALDQLRTLASPTILRHHLIKRCDTLTDNLDFLEWALKRGTPPDAVEILGERLEAYYLDNKALKRDCTFNHRKLGLNHPLTLTKGVVVQSDGTFFVVRREMRGKGVYDGLDVPKERGDYDLCSFAYGSWVLFHRYYRRNGVLKGVYVNVSLPILVDMGAASWLDLEVDVVVFADGTKQIVDQAFLDRFARQNDVPQRVMDGPIRTILDTLLEPSLDLRKPNTDKEICTRLSY